MGRQQSQRESEVMFFNLPESGVDCPLIQFRDSHICVSLVKVFPLGQSRRSTLRGACSGAGKVCGAAERGGGRCAGTGGGRGRRGEPSAACPACWKRGSIFTSGYFLELFILFFFPTLSARHWQLFLPQTPRLVINFFFGL